MKFVKLDTSLFPIVYLDYPNNCTDEIFIENYIKLSKKLIKLEPIDTKYSLVHNLTKASTSNILGIVVNTVKEPDKELGSMNY